MSNLHRKTLFQRTMAGVGSFFDKIAKTEKSTTEEGTDAGSIQSGYSYADNNLDWRTSDRKDTVQNMLLDEKINQVLSAYKKPLTAASFYIQPAVDEKGESSPQDIANALILEKNLFEEMDFSWRAFVKDAVTSLEWGHAVFEKIYKYDGQWKVKKLAFRPQKTIEKWSMENGMPGVMQQLTIADIGEKHIYNIPQEKLLIFTNDKIGDNPEGTSILRPVYRAWKIKDMVWKYHVRILEKFSGGIIQVWVPQGTQQDAIDSIETILEDITASKQSGIVHPGPKSAGWEAEFMDLKIGDTKILETMQKLDNGISESLLNSFLDSTNGQAGSYARSESLKDFFNQALNGWLDYFCEEFNSNVGKELAYLNGWKNVPKLCYHPIKNGVEIDKFASAVSSLKSAQALNIGEDDEDAIREIIGLPERVYKEGKDGEDDGDNGDDNKEVIPPEDMKDEKIAEMKKYKKDEPYTGCVMLNVSGMEEMQIDKNDLSEDGYDGNMHVTLLYGLNTNLSKDEIAKKINYNGQKIVVEGMEVFEQDTQDVLVLKVKKDAWLDEANKSLRELDYKNDYPDYTPHITLGYFKKGAYKKYITKKYDGAVLDGGDIVYTSSPESLPSILAPTKEAKMSVCGCGHAHDDLSKFQRTLISAQRAKHFSIPDFRSLVANKKSFTGSRELTTFEKKANLGGLDDYTREVKKFLDEQMTDITERQKEYMLAIVKEAVSKNDISILENAKIPHQNELIELLTEITKESFEAGKITASQEIGAEVPKTSKDVRGVIRAEQVAVVAGFIAGLKLNATNSVTQVLKRKGNDITETSTAEAVNNARVGLDGYITKQKSGYNTSAVMGSINAGRSSVYEDNTENVVYAQYSAILDGNTTERCRELDGRIVRYGSPEYYSYSPPGHYNCRSVWIGIMKDEAGVDKINLKHIPSSIPPTGPLGSFRDLNQEE